MFGGFISHSDHEIFEEPFNIVQYGTLIFDAEMAEEGASHDAGYDFSVPFESGLPSQSDFAPTTDALDDHHLSQSASYDISIP